MNARRFFLSRNSNVLAEVQDLLGDDADVEAQNRFLDTPLHFAVRYSKNNLEVIKELLERGADVNAKDWHGDLPLHSAFSYRTKNFEVFISHRDMRFNIAHGFRNSLLHNALQNRPVELDVIKLLLQRGADVNAKNCWSYTPLHSAVKFCHNGLEEIRLLIKYGSNINAQNMIGDTPLHKAVLKQGDNVEAIKELLKHGADITIKNSTEETPLLLFLRECVVKRCEGTTPCDLDCAKFLIKCTLIQMSKKVNLETVLIDPILEELLTMFDKDLLTYYKECVSEILHMKTDVVIHNKSLYDHLVSEGDSLRNLKKEEINIIVDHIFHQLAKNTYPLLGVGFVSNILSRSNLFNKLSELQVCSTHVEGGKERIIKLYSCSLFNIASYLSDTELINLILAINGGKESNGMKTTNLPTCPAEMNNDLKRSLSSFLGCCTKHARLESPCATGFDYSYESKALTLQRYEQE